MIELLLVLGLALVGSAQRDAMQLIATSRAVTTPRRRLGVNRDHVSEL
jgi:hypothetical protein